jgi:hypothetical protein
LKFWGVTAPVPVEAAGANVTPCVDDGRVNEVEPRPEDAPDGAALIPESSWGPCFSPPHDTTSDGVGSAPGSFDIVNLGVGELGLPGCPRAQLLPARWRQVPGGAELTCSWVAITHQLLMETLTMVGRDVLQLAQVIPKMERRSFLLIPPQVAP